MNRKKRAGMKLKALICLFIMAGGVSSVCASSGDFFSDFDADGDGVVSQAEFSGPDDHFSNLDANGDGEISSDEGPTGPPGGGPGGEGRGSEGAGEGPGGGHGGGPGGRA